MRKRPLFSVTLVPSTPIKEERLSTSGSLQNSVSEGRLLPVGHGGIGNRLRRFGNALNKASILDRKKALGDDDIKKDRQQPKCCATSNVSDW